MRKLLPLLFGLVLATPAAWATSSTTFELENLAGTAGLGTGILGTVTLTQASSTEVDVSVILGTGYQLVQTSNGNAHTAFTFNLDSTILSGSYSVTGIAPAEYTLASGSVTNSPYGDFTDGLNCTSCKNGAKGSFTSTLSFKVIDLAGITISDFTTNTGSYYFSADVLNTSNGSTGAIAAVPEPETYAMLIAGLGIIGWAARRRLNA